MKRGVLSLLAAAFVAAGFSFLGNKVEALGTNYDSSAFVTTWKTDNPGTVNSSSINLTFSSPSPSRMFNIDWECDGVVDLTTNGLTRGVNGEANTITYNYGTPGTYNVCITGDFPGFAGSNGSIEKIIDVKQWGPSAITSLSFAGAKNLNISAQDTPNLSKVTHLNSAFNGVKGFDSANCGNWNWDTSTITSMGGMFTRSNFNCPIGSWDVSKVTNMSHMFYQSTDFNQNLSTWNTAKVTTMQIMFEGNRVFNNGQAPGVGGTLTWDTSSLVNMNGIFMYNSSFNQDVSSWNTSNVTDMGRAFFSNTLFNNGKAPGVSGELNWDTSKVVDAYWMFRGASSFNHRIGQIGKFALLKNADSMFAGASKFNQYVGDWSVSNLSVINSMFQGATIFNNGKAAGEGGELGWNITNKVNSLVGVFKDARAFNQDISGWDTSNVTTLRIMFEGGLVFNNGMTRGETKILPWDVSKVKDFYAVFAGADWFDQDISGWNISSATSLHSMFTSANSFSQDISGWNYSNVSSIDNFINQSGVRNPIDRPFTVALYDKLLKAWDSQNLNPNLSPRVSQYYCTAATERQNVITQDGWTINDLGKACPPTNINLSNTSVDEKATVVGNLTAVDEENNATRFAIVAGEGGEDNAKFRIVNDNRLEFISAPDFENPTDANGDNKYNVRVKVTDATGLTYEKSFVITVNDIDEVPPVITLDTPVLVDNKPIEVKFTIKDDGGVNLNSVRSSNVVMTNLQCNATVVENGLNKEVACTALMNASGRPVMSAYDVKGNHATSLKSDTPYLVVDRVAPSVNGINIDTASGVNNPTITFTPSDTGDISTGASELTTVVTFKNSSGQMETREFKGTSTQNLSLNLDPSEKVHTVSFEVRDRAGNVYNTSVSFPPIVEFNTTKTVSNQTINDAKVVITSPAGNPITNIQLEAGTTGATLGACTGAGGDTQEPYDSPVSCDIQNIANTGEIKVIAEDFVFNATGNNSIKFIIDKSAPTITVNSPTTLSAGIISDTKVTVTDDMGVNASDVQLSNLANMNAEIVQCNQINDKQVDCDVRVNNTNNIQDVKFSIQAFDVNGNQANQTSTGYYIDTVAPNVSLIYRELSGISGPVYVNSDLANGNSQNASGACESGVGPFNVEFTTTTPEGDSIVYNLEIVDCNPNKIQEMASAVVNSDSIPDGIVKYVVTQADNVGNVGRSKGEFKKDTQAPMVSLNDLPDFTNQALSISGTYNDNFSGMAWVNVSFTNVATGEVVEFDSDIDYGANGGLVKLDNGSWSLENQSLLLGDGEWKVVVTAMDDAGNSIQPIEKVVNVDTAAPTGTVDPVVPNIANSPKITGAIDVNEPETTKVFVIINNQEFEATRNPDGTWELPEGSIQPALTVGVHDFKVELRDNAGNITTIDSSLEVQRPDVDVPTVNNAAWLGDIGDVTGTYDSKNSVAFEVTVGGKTYVLGVDPELTADGDNWKLDLSNSGLAPGSYDVIAASTARNGEKVYGQAVAELKVIEANVVNIAKNLLSPNTGIKIGGIKVSMLVITFLAVFISSFGLFLAIYKRRRAQN